MLSLGTGSQQALGPLDDRRQIAELLDLLAGEGVDHRQIVGGVGEGDRRVGAELGEGRVDGLLGLTDHALSATDGPGRDVA